ncbi:MAG: serine hydrolase domain-containing protein [Rhodanobacter sp.]
MNAVAVVSNTAFSQVDSVIDEVIERQEIVGAVVLISQHGRIVHQRAAGWLDRDAQRPMRSDAIFRLSSLTKPMVSATALALVERGLIDLDDTLERRLPEFKVRTENGEPASITLRQLLTHTAGFDYSFLQSEDGAYQRAGVSDGIAEPGLAMDEQLKRLAGVPLSYAPGTAWRYSVALDVLGEVLARAGGASLPELVRRYVTEPLGMQDTGFTVRDIQRLAVPYADGMPAQPMTDPQVVPFVEGLAGIRFSPSRVFDSHSFPSGGAGMVGTAPDFMHFLQTVTNGGGAILTTESTRSMMHNQIGDLRIDVEPTPSWGFGFGGAVLLDQALAGGPQANGTWKWGGVYGHHWFVDPSKELVVTVLTNTGIAGMMGNFATALQEAIYAAL